MRSTCEFIETVKSRAQLRNGEYLMDLEQLRELCFDARLTEEQHRAVMVFVKIGDDKLANIKDDAGVQHFEGGLRYKMLHS